ncbi:type II secretion system protein GspN [Halobacteriovorax marinus]|uniref:type II secretion system protein GspN n=1 Tax=Halobacteriovorax marinus TaxID=97084 RepID=UPI000BC2C6A2|nr:type II secretion system protein GspN [Halobacteriovorax marinus]ATH07506.1 type II secretion system protein GspN [Halobacteriovorax marinus]
MVKLKTHPNELPDEIYIQKKTYFAKVAMASSILIFLAFLMNFPIGTILKSQVENAIRSNPTCPITYDEMRFEWFLPKVILTKPVVSGRCYSNPSSSLKLSDLVISFQSPSFWPLGIKLHSKVKHKLSVINIYPTVGIGGTVIKVEKSSLSHKTLKEFLGTKSLNFTGDIEIESLVKIDGSKLSQSDFLITSSNLSIPGQNIGGFDLPNLPIGALQLKGSLNSKDLLEIQDFQLGSPTSPVMAEANGVIKLNTHNMSNSTLDIAGEVKFSPSFLENFAIINMMLSGKESTNKGFYKFKVGGKFAAPMPSFN